MRTLYLTTLMAMLLCACSSSRGGEVAEGDRPQNEDEAYEVTGDVRVYYYVKEVWVDSARTRDSRVQQEELKNTLVNQSHTLFRGEPEHLLPEEVRFLYNSDMYDLLRIFQERGFFDRGNAVNIFGEDPIRRADREPMTTRVIAVEIIKDGKVNTSYFARKVGENTAPSGSDEWDRSVVFNECQSVFMQAVAGSLPRGTAAHGAGDTRKIGRD